MRQIVIIFTLKKAECADAICLILITCDIASLTLLYSSGVAPGESCSIVLPDTPQLDKINCLDGSCSRELCFRKSCRSMFIAATAPSPSFDAPGVRADSSAAVRTDEPDTD